MSDQRRFENDAFTPSRLPVATRHPPRTGRGRLFLYGAGAMVLLILPFLADTLFGNAAAVSNGPLSDSHALFARDCANCHAPGGGTPDVRCSNCHEKAGDPLGTYSYRRHYVYRSADFDRSAPSTRETPCAACHDEHRGRTASLERVTDATCRACHKAGSFSSGHPQFDFIADSVPDPANLLFTHVRHVREIMKRDSLTDLEATCVRCHEPEPEGRFFQPISFARHCDDCHLSASDATPLLPLAGRGTAAGVLSLQDIRNASSPGADAANYWDSNEFREAGGFILKRPVYHEDPWILYNLNRLRQQLYPGAALAQLLRASADVPPGQGRVLPQEAVATLRSWIQALRGEPSRDVQNELRSLESLLDVIERRMEDPLAPVDLSRFAAGVADRPAADPIGSLADSAVLPLADSLTTKCRECHIVERATILRVQTDQRTLNRAEFSHRAHIIHARCLDCHTAIPIRDWVDRDKDVPASLDRASIQNLPGIEVCRRCHGSGRAPADCTQCHRFHPDHAQWSNLSRQNQRVR